MTRQDKDLERARAVDRDDNEPSERKQVASGSDVLTYQIVGHGGSVLAARRQSMIEAMLSQQGTKQFIRSNLAQNPQ